MFLWFFRPIVSVSIPLILLAEEIVTCSVTTEEETGAVNVGAPLLRYTNHERHSRGNEDCAV